ncbi:MAG: MarR family transcriptional regulator [Nibricoccus sp.]
MPTTPSPAAKTHYQVLASLRYALRRFLAFSQNAARNAGLTPQQHQALLSIKGFRGPGNASIGDLAEHLFLKHHSTVGLVDRLVQKKFVRRIEAPSDRRRVELELTPKGEAMIKRLSDIHLRELRQIRPELQRIIASIPDSRALSKVPRKRS